MTPMTRLVQLKRGDARRVALVEGPKLLDVFQDLKVEVKCAGSSASGCQVARFIRFIPLEVSICINLAELETRYVSRIDED